MKSKGINPLTLVWLLLALLQGQCLALRNPFAALWAVQSSSMMHSSTEAAQVQRKCSDTATLKQTIGAVAPQMMLSGDTRSMAL